MRSGEVAERAGVNVQTLRYYERRGLIGQPPRSLSGYRAFPAATVETVRFVKRAQELGFTLEEIGDLLELAAGGPQECDAARAMAQTRGSELHRRIADLERMRDSLAELITTCDRPRPDRRCPLLRALHTEQEDPR
jgi:MerR family transcriptional regulator, mercuric resistance operon regulatory protein